ncbi:S8 family serine peptidase [Bradyrhizobium sp. AUGA SZCCT0431]|uniref:S8 family serine peptidase n=1 Tax=Bradyrhizobium sp. AUGA SZCCT0431 TaxID=2807674 RepID=UPI001BA5AB7E|nr:S8 family serine peptidase [Bradyrhizobium sp. AUGA SZCCT0431]MBR1147527.1 S8 family serine peptidase [Bradyrhizobium sp. AUGA SZCCT0431]
MTRVFYRRGQRVEVEQLEGIAALKLQRSPDGVRSANREQFGTSIPRADAAARGFVMNPEEAAAFERADWIFVEPSAATRGVIARRQTPGGAYAVGSVVRDEDGRLAIVNDELVVKLVPTLTEAQASDFLTVNGLKIIRQLSFAPNLFEVRAIDGKDGIDKSAELHGQDSVLSAEPNLIQHLPGRQTPSDPEYLKQWQWHNSGAGGGIAGADVGAEIAWNITRGAGVRVAVIDNGFDPEHEDLRANIDPISGRFDPTGSFQQGTASIPSAPHGTFCAAQVAAVADNHLGGCGAAPEAKLILICIQPDQVGTQTTLARGVAYAADPTTENVAAKGADILSCSLGPNGAAWELQTVMDDALKFAASKGRGGLGLPIFWATTNGNGPISKDHVVSHPAIIRVGRSTRSDTENNSGFGPELDFLAPGVDVFNAVSAGYSSWTGTSFAAPLAAGVAALVLSVASFLSPEQVRKLMQDTCKKIGGVPYTNGRNDDYGFGRVNAQLAVLQAKAMADAKQPKPARPANGNCAAVAALDSERKKFMQEATRLAIESVEKGWGGPFGAVIVKNGVIIGRGQSRVLLSGCPVDHAEITAIIDASARLNPKALIGSDYAADTILGMIPREAGSLDPLPARARMLKGCEIYVNCAPCPMCLSAIYWSRIDRVYCSASLEDARQIGFEDVVQYEELVKPLTQQRIPVTDNFERDIGLEAYRAWMNKQDRHPF